MKKLTAILITFLLTLGVCFSFGCSKPQKITDMKRFKGMTEQTDRIDVSYDNNTGKSFNFSITDKTEIEEIMQIVLNTPLEDLGEGLRLGDFTYITIIQGEKEYKLHESVNAEGNHSYTFKDGALMYKIKEKATKLGAEDYEMGTVLKVGDAVEISSEEKDFATKEELNAYVEQAFSNDYYLYVFKERGVGEVETHKNIWGDSSPYVVGIKVPSDKYLTVYTVYRSYKSSESPYIIKAIESKVITEETTLRFEYYTVSVKFNVTPYPVSQ